MRSTARFAFAALASLALSLPASAQERERLRLGVGVGISTFDFNVQMLATSFPAAVPDHIYVPISLTPTFRIEGQIGAATLNQNAGTGFTSVETSVVSVGLGAFWLLPASPQFDVYVGGRVLRTSYSSTLKTPGQPDNKTEGADIRVIPAVGGEYFLHPRFSLGAEVQLQLVSFGNREVSSGGSIPGGSGVQTAGLLFARVYLF
jgi:hypothetical protein